MQLSATSRMTVASISLVMFAAVSATIVLLSLFLASFSIIFGLISAIFFVAALVACGNIRLFCLWGLILAAPLELNVSFNINVHTGGASAITIDAIDVFMLPLLVFLIRDYYQGYRFNVRIPKVLYWWLALIFLGLMTIVFGPMRNIALLEVVSMLKLTLLFTIIVNEVVRIKQFKHVVAALMIGIFLQGIAALAQYGFDFNFGAQILGESTKEGTEYLSRATYRGGGFTNRVGGLFGHPNLLSIYLAMLLPIGLSVLFSGIKPIYKYLTAIIVVIGVIALVLTLSRSGWLSFSIAFVTLMIVSYLDQRLRNKYVFSRILSIIAIFILAIALSGPIMKRLTQSDPGAVSFRWEYMGVAMNMVKEKPILGFGLNSFVWQMPPYSDYKTYEGVRNRFGEVLPVVHNIYLLIWAEQGTVGLVLYLLFYFHLLRIAKIGLTIYKEPFLAMVNLGCFAGLLALMVDGMASFFIRSGNGGRMFFIVAALVVAIRWWHFDNIQNRTSNKIST